MQKDSDYEALKKKALQQLKTGKSLFGKDGALAPMLKEFLESALEGEMDAHLDQEERSKGNRRNGKARKTVKTSQGSLDIETSRDRQGSFAPNLIRKRETILAESLEDKILGLYGLGMSFRDISQHIEQMYDTKVSATTLSSITDRIIPKIKEWQARPLESVYCIVWMDAMFFKVRENDRVVTRCMYNIMGINTDGHKDILGMYVAQTEGANFWLSVLTDLQNRGVEDLLIVCIDNLKGFAEAIETIYPEAEVQTCVIHQIRNSLRYVSHKDKKAVMKDLKLIYQADTLDQAERALEQFVQIWSEKYPIVTQSWQKNWHRLSTYFKYSKPIRKLIYTTNAIEGYHRQIRKVTKNKGAFPSDMALLKLVWLGYRQIRKKWKTSLWNWNTTLSQLSIIFGDRLKLQIS